MKTVKFIAAALLLAAGQARAGAIIGTAIGNGYQGGNPAGMGTGDFNGDNLPALSSELNYPIGVAVDAAGNVYVGDSMNQRVRKLTVATGLVSTVAGNGTQGFTGDGGAATAAELYRPSAVALDRAHNFLYATTDSSYRIRKIDLNTGLISTYGGIGTWGSSGDGGLATAAQFSANALAVNSQGDLFVADPAFYRVRKIAFATGIITTYAGTGVSGNGGDNGPATSAQVIPWVVECDASDNVLIGDLRDVRRVDASTGIISRVAGTGVALTGSEAVLTPTVGTTYLGDGGPALNALFWVVQGLTTDAAGNIYISDGNFSVVRQVSAIDGSINRWAGDYTNGWSGDGGPADQAQLYQPLRLATAPDGTIYIVDNINNLVRALHPAGSPTPTPTPTPTFTATATATASPTPANTPSACTVCGTLDGLYGFNQSSLNVQDGVGFNYGAGAWKGGSGAAPVYVPEGSNHSLSGFIPRGARSEAVLTYDPSFLTPNQLWQSMWFQVSQNAAAAEMVLMDYENAGFKVRISVFGPHHPDYGKMKVVYSTMGGNKTAWVNWAYGAGPVDDTTAWMPISPARHVFSLSLSGCGLQVLPGWTDPATNYEGLNLSQTFADYGPFRRDDGSWLAFGNQAGLGAPVDGYIDDIRVYRCGAFTPPTLTPTPVPGAPTAVPTQGPWDGDPDHHRVRCWPNYSRGDENHIGVDVRSFSGGHCGLKVMRSNNRGICDLWQGNLRPRDTLHKDWDCRGDHGEIVASGVYYVVFTDGDGSTFSQKILIVR